MRSLRRRAGERDRPRHPPEDAHSAAACLYPARQDRRRSGDCLCASPDHAPRRRLLFRPCVRVHVILFSLTEIIATRSCARICAFPDASILVANALRIVFLSRLSFEYCEIGIRYLFCAVGLCKELFVIRYQFW